MDRRNTERIKQLSRMMPSHLRKNAIKKQMSDPHLAEVADSVLKKLSSGSTMHRMNQEEVNKAQKRWQGISRDASKVKETVDEKKEQEISRWWDKRIKDDIKSGRLDPSKAKKDADGFMKEIGIRK